MASRQMLSSLLSSATRKHLARTHLFLSPRAGLSRNRFWENTVESDVLVFDFQDGCPPKERGNVFRGLESAHYIYPNIPLSVRITELERNEGSRIYDEIKASLDQKQVYWLMLPMCDDADDVQEYIKIIQSIDPNWLESHGALQMITETPKGLYNLDDILDRTPQMKGVIAGGGDYFRFAQGTNESLLSKFRWDVLNICLIHGVFPIDTPPLVLSAGQEAKTHFQNGHDAGFRSGLLLHPKQTRLANDSFSPSEAFVKENAKIVEGWMGGRETGYKRGSEEDFFGPPHMKQKEWTLRYYEQILSKKVTFTRRFDTDVIESLKSLLGSSLHSSTNMSFNSKDFRTLLYFAFASSCHPRHHNLIANLGYSNVEITNLEGREDFALDKMQIASSQIVGRRVTSNGSLLVTYKVEIINRT